MPKISVIVPVYKAQAYLEACVESILSQTEPDFELILVDDGSPDGSGAMCDRFAAQDRRVSVIHQENQGQAAARNHALEQASAPWVCFVDSDDLIHPQTLELLYQAARQEDAPMSMAKMAEQAQLPVDFFRPRTFASHSLGMDEQTLVDLHDRDQYPAWVACAKLIRRDVVDSHWFCPGRVYEDNEAVCHWILAAGKLAVVEEDLYFYRTNPESTTQSGFSRKKLDYLWALEQIIRFYGQAGYFRLRQRFAQRYGDAVASAVRGLGQELECRREALAVYRAGCRFLKKEQLTISRQTREDMLDAAHPKLIRLYWPLAGAVRTLKEGGIAGAWRKVCAHLGKGETS